MRCLGKLAETYGFLRVIKDINNSSGFLTCTPHSYVDLHLGVRIPSLHKMEKKLAVVGLQRANSAN